MYWYVHKYQVHLEYGGPAEGGWWFTAGSPVDGEPLRRFTTEAEAEQRCRELNQLEMIRREREERYEFTSVLSYQSTHYSYDVSESPKAVPFPAERPHYE